MVSDKALFSVFNDFAKVQVNNFETAADKQKQQPPNQNHQTLQEILCWRRYCQGITRVGELYTTK
jgi:hypothetical protein